MVDNKTNSNVQPFIVKNGFNTCYIDSLLMALFAAKSTNDFLLNKDVEVEAIYLQEFIKINFVDKVRNNLSVDEEMINNIRLLCIENGWKSESLDEMYEQQDVSEFYSFLLNRLSGNLIEIKRSTISEGLTHKDDKGSIERIPFIPLSIPPGRDYFTVKELINRWMFDNPTELERLVPTTDGQEIKNIMGLNTYNIVNHPNIMAISINRFANINERNNCSIIIQKKINFVINSSLFNNPVWAFHAAICHVGDNIKSGHYYSLIQNNDGNFYIFDDQKIPCLYHVDMSDPSTTRLIKKDVVFIIYKYFS